MRRLRKDIAPGEPHVAWRQGHVNYYVPALFHLAPTNAKIVPLAIRDIVKCKSMLEIYGVQGLDKHNSAHVMIHNYPVRTVKIRGRVLSYRQLSYNNKGSTVGFWLVYLDDYSGEQSSICAKVPTQTASFPPFAMKNDVLLEITGTVSYQANYSKQLMASSARIVGTARDFDVELAWWREVLAVRRFLAVPWKYRQSEGSTGGSENGSGFEGASRSVNFRLSKKDTDRRRRKQQLDLYDEPEFQSVSDSLEPDLRPNTPDVVVVDSESEDEFHDCESSNSIEFYSYDTSPLGTFRSQTVEDALSDQRENRKD